MATGVVSRIGVVLSILLLSPAASALSGTATASANTPKSVVPSVGRIPSGCKRTDFTADGGYFSAGHFYLEPEYDVTLITNWCYSTGVITSHSERYTTTIPSNLGLRLSKSVSLIKEGTVLDVQLAGTYNSNVINNTGAITIIGHVTGHGRHHFVNDSGAGG
jgi:hypothetical protein